MIKNIIAFILLHFFCNLNGQDSIKITSVYDCEIKLGNDKKIEEEKAKRFEDFVLNRKVEELKKLSKVERIEYFRKVLGRGMFTEKYLHPDGNYYSIPFEPICHLLNWFSLGYEIREGSYNRLELLATNSEFINSVTNYIGKATKIRIWEFYAHQEDEDNYLDIELYEDYLRYNHYSLRYKGNMITADKIRLKSGVEQITKKERDDLESLLRKLSFSEIPNTRLCVLDGHELVIEIKSKAGYNIINYPNIDVSDYQIKEVKALRRILGGLNKKLGIKMKN